MPLTNLRYRYCPISEGCKRRGDSIGKTNLREIKTECLANDLTTHFHTIFKVGDIICTKHYKQFYDKDNRKNKFELNQPKNEKKFVIIEKMVKTFNDIETQTI